MRSEVVWVGDFVSLYTYGLEDLIQAHIITRYFVCPDLLSYTLALGEDAEMRTRFCLEPLEVIDLIPLVRRLRHLRCHLHIHNQYPFQPIYLPYSQIRRKNLRIPPAKAQTSTHYSPRKSV